MKPLVNYCRWNEAKLRLRGRDDQFLRGELVFRNHKGNEETQEFKYDLARSQLVLIKESVNEFKILDEMGVVTDEWVES